ncbi:hypothetical protein KIN20_037400 [Parelaphostrongylus tenuis]|uniref:Uncharacterized protein n=1 Tax=Parelaphostrongylus tenuis TaxID=148309 RepID=A0AAD5REN6_PARTN|nr:hypothetical protein KIN20_037400 [Parelaphostrongylus tenuis]
MNQAEKTSSHSSAQSEQQASRVLSDAEAMEVTLEDASKRTSLQTSAEILEDDKKWIAIPNLVRLYRRGVKLVTLYNLPDQESWYKEVFNNYNASGSASGSTTASSQEREDTNSSSTAPKFVTDG